MPERMTPDQADLLIERVGRLSKKLEISEKVTKRMTRVMYALGGLVIILGFVVVEQYQDGKDIQTSRVQQCVNGNETRAGQEDLWDFIIDVSTQTNPDASAAEEEFYDDLRAYVHDLFAPRDCTDLTKKYETPDPPAIPSLAERKEGR